MQTSWVVLMGRGDFDSDGEGGEGWMLVGSQYRLRADKGETRWGKWVGSDGIWIRRDGAGLEFWFLGRRNGLW
jgi:hypothetical protein